MGLGGPNGGGGWGTSHLLTFAMNLSSVVRAIRDVDDMTIQRTRTKQR